MPFETVNNLKVYYGVHGEGEAEADLGQDREEVGAIRSEDPRWSPTHGEGG